MTGTEQPPLVAAASQARAVVLVLAPQRWTLKSVEARKLTPRLVWLIRKASLLAVH